MPNARRVEQAICLFFLLFQNSIYSATLNANSMDVSGLSLHFVSKSIVSIEVTPGLSQEVENGFDLLDAEANRVYQPQLNSHPEGAFYSDRLKILVETHSRCSRVIDRHREMELVRICPSQTSRDWQELSLQTHLDYNVYGLGQYFRNPGTADGDWVGHIWDPGFENPGNQKLRAFHGGANGDILIPVAYFLGQGTENFAIFLDHVEKQMWSFDQMPWRIGTRSGPVRFYVIAGDSLQNLRQQYMDLVGRPPMPPKEVFGFWLSKFGYRNWQEVLEEHGDLQEAKFPVDGFVLDLQWFGGRFYPNGSNTSDSKMGSLTFDLENFPDPAMFIKNMRRQQIKIMPIEESYIAYNLPEHTLLSEKGYLVKNCHTGAPVYLDSNPWWGVGSMIDWLQPEAGDYWFKNKRSPLIDMGIHFHWTDLGEPEMYDPNGCYNGIHHNSAHNLYNLKWTQSIHEGYQKYHPEKRHFILSRSGNAGSQKYGAGIWSGDIAANMGALTAHLNSQLHMSLSGIDYYGSDVGGFHRREESVDGDIDELYTQWFANSSLFDFPLRPHAWSVGEIEHQTSPVRIGDRKSNLFNLKRRYRLFPYYYSLAYKAFAEGDAIIRPMVYDFQTDYKLRKVGHQKMIGPFLMAGVVASYGEQSRDIYLPTGGWFDLESSHWYFSEGQDVFDVPTTKDGVMRLPLFAREGAIIPRFPNPTGTNNIGQIFRSPTVGRWQILIIPSANKTHFDVYDDDGETTAYKGGQYRLIRFTQHEDARGILVTKETLNDDPAIPRRELDLEMALKGGRVKQVEVDDQVLQECSHFAEIMHDSCYRLLSNGKRLFVKNLQDFARVRVNY